MASCFCRRVDEKRLNRKTRDPAPRTLLLRLVSGGRERARSCLLKATSQAARARRYRVELITAESEASLFVRHRRLIRFPQLTMPLLAAWTPDHWEVSHTDEIVQRVDFNKPVDLVGITANTPATRGCPFACDYCPIPQMYQRRMRYRPVAEVVSEIRRMPGRALIFWDDNIGANHAYAKELFAAIAPFKRWWTSQCTADVAFDEEFLSLAARSGCKALFLGLETISQASLNVANKRHNRAAEYREVIRRFHAHGIAVQAGVVFGFDHDDRTIFRTTVEVYRSAGLDSATVSVLIPFPNTPLFQRLDAES